MDYNLKLRINTSGTYQFPYIPNEMGFDGCEVYYLEKIFKSVEEMSNYVKEISEFLLSNSTISSTAGKSELKNMFESFLKRIEKFPNFSCTREEFLDEYCERSYIEVSRTSNKVDCTFYLDDNEYKIYQKALKDMTYGDIKQSILNLCKEKIKEKENGNS